MRIPQRAPGEACAALSVVCAVALGALCLALASAGGEADKPQTGKGENAAPAPEMTAAQRVAALEEQASLWQTADSLPSDKPEARDAVARALALEKTLFPEPTHLLHYLTEQAAAAADRARDADAARAAHADAVALQSGFLGDRPGKELVKDADPLRQALEVRERVLGANHRWVALTLVDAALAKEVAGRLDESQASLAKALDIFKAARDDYKQPRSYQPDARYHLERIQFLTDAPSSKAAPEELALRLKEAQRRCDEAEAAEAKGDVAGAVSKYETALNFQGFGGAAFTASERDFAEASNGYHAILGRYLSFASRSNRQDKKGSRYITLPQGNGAGSPSPAVIDTKVPKYQSLSGLKGAVFTRALCTRLERHHPLMNPFCQAYEDISRRLAASVAGADGAEPAEGRALRARRDALEAEMGRRRAKLPQFLPAAPALQLPAGAALVDYLVYEYTSLPVEGKEKPPPERRLACFISRPNAEEVYLELGALAPVEEAVGKWRRALGNPKADGRGVKRRPLSGDGDPDAARRLLRERLWAPLLPYLDKAEIVLISPDGPLALIPFAALPGDKPGMYLLEEQALAVAPVPRLIKPLHSQADFLARRGDWATVVGLPPDADDSPLLVGDVDFAAAPEKTDEVRPLAHKNPFAGIFPPLPGTAREVESVGALFEESSPGKKPERLTGAGATKAAVCRAAPSHRWLHLATHGFFEAGRPPAAPDLPELRSALALAGASAEGPGGEGLLTALETSSLDLDRVDLAVLSACETGLGDVHEGEGVLGLQRAFLAAGARTTVTSLWQVDDEGTRALMVEFYRNLWDRKLDKLESLRQDQLAMLRGQLYRPTGARADEGEPRLPPFYWAAFTLGGDWRADKR